VPSRDDSFSRSSCISRIFFSRNSIGVMLQPFGESLKDATWRPERRNFWAFNRFWIAVAHFSPDRGSGGPAREALWLPSILVVVLDLRCGYAADNEPWNVLRKGRGPRSEPPKL
jgi:hypothetical protein